MLSETENAGNLKVPLKRTLSNTFGTVLRFRSPTSPPVFSTLPPRFRRNRRRGREEGREGGGKSVELDEGKNFPQIFAGNLAEKKNNFSARMYCAVHGERSMKKEEEPG